MSRPLLIAMLLLATTAVPAEGVPEDVPTDSPESSASAEAEANEAPEQTAGDTERILGMSILGNQEAPKSLVIVPWKTSELGESLGISTMLDDTRRPIDRDVFMRALSYYEIRSESKP